MLYSARFFGSPLRRRSRTPPLLRNVGSRLCKETTGQEENGANTRSARGLASSRGIGTQQALLARLALLRDQQWLSVTMLTSPRGSVRSNVSQFCCRTSPHTSPKRYLTIPQRIRGLQQLLVRAHLVSVDTPPHRDPRNRSPVSKASRHVQESRRK